MSDPIQTIRDELNRPVAMFNAADNARALAALDALEAEHAEQVRVTDEIAAAFQKCRAEHADKVWLSRDDFELVEAHVRYDGDLEAALGVFKRARDEQRIGEKP